MYIFYSGFRKKKLQNLFLVFREKENVVFALYFFLKKKKIKERKKYIYLALWFSFLDTRRRTTVDKVTPNKQLGLLESPL